MRRVLLLKYYNWELYRKLVKPQALLPQPLAARTQPNGLWLAGLVTDDDVELPENVQQMQAEWQMEPLLREASAQVLLAVEPHEAQGPVPAGLMGPIWRLPGPREHALATRALLARLTR